MDKRSILELFSFYRNAPRSLQAQMSEVGGYAKLPADTYFYREGDSCGQFAVVGRGSIRVFKAAETGREVTLYHVHDGQPCLVNMLCVFLGRPAMASAKVEVPTEAVVFAAAAFREWVRTDDGVRRFIFETMAARLVDVMTLVEDIAFRTMDDRLGDFLLQHFARVRVISSTHEEIAAELGTAREVVSRLLKELERRGAITLSRGHILLRDAAALATLGAHHGAKKSMRCD